MDSEKKDQVLFALFSAESRGLTGSAKASHVVAKMRSVYGGYWSAWAYDSGFGSYYSEPGYYALFKYEGNIWIVYKHRES